MQKPSVPFLFFAWSKIKTAETGFCFNFYGKFSFTPRLRGKLGFASINLAVSIAYEKTVKKVAQEDTQPAKPAKAWLRRDVMFIGTQAPNILRAPEVRNLADVAYSSPETLRSSGARVGEFTAPVYNIQLPWSQRNPPCCWAVRQASQDRRSWDWLHSSSLGPGPRGRHPAGQNRRRQGNGEGLAREEALFAGGRLPEQTSSPRFKWQSGVFVAQRIFMSHESARPF